jgi:hypothetical protein
VEKSQTLIISYTYYVKNNLQFLGILFQFISPCSGVDLSVALSTCFVANKLLPTKSSNLVFTNDFTIHLTTKFSYNFLLTSTTLHETSWQCTSVTYLSCFRPVHNVKSLQAQLGLLSFTCYFPVLFMLWQQ